MWITGSGDRRAWRGEARRTPSITVDTVTYTLLVATITGAYRGVTSIATSMMPAGVNGAAAIVGGSFTATVTRDILDAKSQTLTLNGTGPRGNVNVALTFP